MLKFCPTQSINDLKYRCQEMLDKPDEDTRPINRALVYGVLYTLCMEYGEDNTDPCLAERYTILARSFLAKLGVAVSDLPLVITPSMYAIMALIISVSYHRLPLTRL